MHANTVLIECFAQQEILPFETKPIMKASFLGRIEDNHTAFIRIKTNKEHEESILVLPVEVEVSSGM